MSSRRKPFRSRWAKGNPLQVINRHGTHLTAAEVASIIGPVRECFAQIRAGTATELQATVMHTTMLIAEEIERGGIVRGLAEHISTARAACEAYFGRSLGAGAWRPSAVHFHELDALAVAIDLHVYQLQQLTSAELDEIKRKVITRAQSSGREVLAADSDLGTARPYRHRKNEVHA
ncbi:MAG: hypothetical protein E2581_17525 [Pseudomonas sp.]|uniref:hypothetical protein n=1 Tax=Pseudomonas sp. TaxID=306 RepID=UPI001DBF2A2E|nr:hypothetical protein [Pseudomonas sp.]MPT00283.1 hypothetical protein [Pseudomonas sp.]